VNDAVAYVGKILHNSKLQNMTVEEREAKVSALRSLAGAIGAQRGHEAKLKAIRQTFANDLPEVCRDLPEICQTFAGDVVLVEVDGLVSVPVPVGDAAAVADQPTAKSKAAAAAPPDARSEERTKEQTKPSNPTNPFRASGFPARRGKDKTRKPKTLKTARGEKPMPPGFDAWTPVKRTEWLACTCDIHEDCWASPNPLRHTDRCSAKPKTKVAAAGATNDLGVEPL
jgi:hypothetical protein